MNYGFRESKSNETAMHGIYIFFLIQDAIKKR
jgi:hypothetical protein